MKGRTRLTTPPGEEPFDDTTPEGSTEAYVPGLTIPVEPDVRSRHRTRLIAAAVVLVLAVGGYVVYRLATEGQFQDPALSDVLPDDGGATGTP